MFFKNIYNNFLYFYIYCYVCPHIYKGYGLYNYTIIYKVSKDKYNVLTPSHIIIFKESLIIICIIT